MEIMVFDVARSKSIEKQVRERGMKRLCLHKNLDDTYDCNKRSLSLGLCETHVNARNYVFRGLSSAAKARYLRSAVQNGEEMKAGEQRRLERMAKSRVVERAAEVS